MTFYRGAVAVLAVAFALMPLTAVDATWLWNSLLWLSVVLALISGAQYLWLARKLEASGQATVIDPVARPTRAE